MKNSQIAEDFIKLNLEKNQKIEGSNFFAEGNVIYSYGYHFPIAIKFQDGFIFNISRYSRTTSKHKGIVRRAIGDRFIQELNTQQMKEIINSDVKSIKEIVFNSI